jgi:hypothetical protein
LWFKEGKFHRLDGPAIEYPDRHKEWYKEGKLHREGSPAVEYSDGRKCWYKEGKKHRIDGPAFIYSKKLKEWWIEDKPCSPERLLKLIKFSVYLGKEKGQYNFEWVKFLTENGVEEFPIFPEMKEYRFFEKVFKKLEKLETK